MHVFQKKIITWSLILDFLYFTDILQFIFYFLLSF